VGDNVDKSPSNETNPNRLTEDSAYSFTKSLWKMQELVNKSRSGLGPGSLNSAPANSRPQTQQSFITKKIKPTNLQQPQKKWPTAAPPILQNQPDSRNPLTLKKIISDTLRM
jgi:hypothetical protein